jgi:hypothetical protein
VNIDVSTRLSAAAELALESSFLENQSNRSAGKKCPLFNAIKVGDVLADPILGRNAISFRALVAAGDGSLKVSRKDRVLQLIQNARLENGTHGLGRRSRDVAISAPSCGFRDAFHWRSL